MHPPLSMIFFTTLAGAAQGLLLALVGLELAGVVLPRPMALAGAVLVLVLSGVGLVAASFHLGHPLRAWRAVAMWRTSWLSREVIAMPIFMALVLAWGLAHWAQVPALVPGVMAAVLAIVLYLCTGMIYAAIKAIREWAHPIVPINYLVLGVASGLLLAAALAASFGSASAVALGALALVTTVLGAATRGYALWRHLQLVPKTTLQSAIGVRHPRIVQKSQGSMGGSFNTREFFHQRSPGFVLRMRWVAAVLGFGLPVLALAAGARSAPVLALLFGVQYLGLLAERWSFFAEGQHTQNLYYDARS
ncbi:MAG: dimethyl sulfoxide reductase anchor subunit family protein [Rubrivivax sp.]|jgi:DMSO reductase anchor subunit|nr:dimethyl sulfoxide reductase anchor subunit [Rubrivivax sp.]